MARPRKSNTKRNGAAASAAAAEEEKVDRISSLPDELIFLIFSFIDIRLAVQTCILSSRWKNLWKTLPSLTFTWKDFHAKTKLSKFVNKFLSNRDRALEVSSINFTSKWPMEPPLFKRILRYGFAHRIQHLEITNDCKDGDKPCLIPISLFRSQSLKHLSLTLASQSSLGLCPAPHQTTLSCPQALIRSPWSLPNLTTLYLQFVPLMFSCNNYAEGSHRSADPFSSLVSLKDLSLVYCDTFDLNTLHIVSNSLEHLTIFSSPYYESDAQSKLEVFVSTPKLTTFDYSGVFPLSISAAADQQLSCLREARISIIHMRWPECEIPVRRVHEMLRMVRNAEFLTISAGAIVLLNRAPELLRYRASPLGNLKLWTIEIGEYWSGRRISENIIQDYLLRSSPNAAMWQVYTGRAYE